MKKEVDTQIEFESSSGFLKIKINATTAPTIISEPIITPITIFFLREQLLFILYCTFSVLLIFCNEIVFKSRKE